MPEMCKSRGPRAILKKYRRKNRQHKLSSAPGSAAWAEIGSKPDNAATAPRNVVFLFIIYLFYVRGRQNKNAGTETIK
ncbi:MAG: hypothetical protein ACLRW2_06140 [Parasutterella excrementihominis]